MNEYIFIASGSPKSRFHKPFSVKLELSAASVKSGIAQAADIVSLRIVAGAAAPDTHSIEFHDLHSGFLNPQITLSANRKRVMSFTAERDDGILYNYWVLYQSHPQNPTMSLVENIVTLTPTRIQIESCVLPIPPKTYVSTFSGSWKAARGNISGVELHLL
jgi:hypothetical protein